MNKIRNKIAKILSYFFFWIGVVIIFIVISAFILLNTGRGRALTAKVISNVIEKSFQTKVEIESAKFIIFSHLILKNVKIYDLHDKPILTIKKINLGLRIPLISNNTIRLRKVVIYDLFIYAKKYNEQEDFNFAYIVDAIKNKSNQSEGKPRRRIIIDRISINNGNFNFLTHYKGRAIGRFDHDDIRAEDLYISAKDFQVNGPHVTFNVESMTTKDHSGLEIKSFASRITIDTNHLYFNKVFMKTNESTIVGDIEFSFNHYPDFKYFIDSINIEATFKQSTLSLHDLDYFAEKIKTNEDNILIEGNVSGRISNLKSNDIKISFGDYSYYKGTASLSGLPNIEETFIDLSTKNTHILFKDLQRLIPNIYFPEYFHNLGLFNFSGKYTGFINDFVAYGKLNTPLGRIRTDINFKIPFQSKIPLYSGKITLENFNLGKFVNKESLLGQVTMNGAIDGTGLTLENVQANLNANIQNLEFNKYSYKNVKLNGDISQEIFKGWLTITDENIGLIFNGTIDMTRAKPVYKFVATINNTNLYKLNLVKDTLTLDCLMDINLEANNIDDVEGEIVIRDTEFKLSNANYKFDNLVISSKLDNQLKTIIINSELAKAKIRGHFSISSLPDMIKASIINYLDTSFLSLKETQNPDDFIEFDIKLINTSFLNKLIGLDVIFEDNTHLKGSINNKNEFFNLECFIPGFYYKEYYLNYTSLIANNHNKSLNIDATVEEIQRNDSSLAENIHILTQIINDSIGFNISLSNRSYNTQLDLNGTLFLRKDSSKVTLKNSLVVSDNKKWVMNSDAMTIYYEPEIIIPSLVLISDEKVIKIFGTISKDPTKSLRCMIENVDIRTIDNYTSIDLSAFSGNLGGQLKIFSLIGSPYFEAGIYVNPIIYNELDTLGILTFTSNKNLFTNKININGMLVSPDLEDIINLKGTMTYSKDKKIDFIIDVPESNVKYFEGFTKEYISDLEGTISANIKIFGKADKPEIDGTISITNFRFNLNYLQTRYQFSHNFKIDQNKIIVDNINLYDKYFNLATINGVINHDYFNNYTIDLLVIASDLYCLNTTVSDNNIFYGQAFADGIVDITGPLDDLNFDINAITRDNTKIYLPVYGDGENGEYHYVRYTDKFDKHRFKPQVNLLGVSINIDIEVNPETEVEIIFDPELGDIMRGNGKGNLKIVLDNLGNVSMYGNYYIENGEYIFTALNLFKRKFKVKEGSSLTWKGDPEEADIDIEAIYELDADFSALMTFQSNTDNDESALPEKLRVQSKILLTESLFSPTTKLDFDIINIGTSAFNNIELDQKIRIIKSNQSELNRQVVSLLALGRFVPIESGFHFEGAINQSISHNLGAFVSNQLSQWISEASNNFDSKYFGDFKIGVNWAGENKLYKKELDILLSTNLFNDRVTINGSYDVYNDNSSSYRPNLEVSYRGKKKRNTRIKVFSRSDRNSIYEQNTSRLGFGVFFTKEFDNFRELFKGKN